ncbi:putative phosphohydrolase [Synechococcus sp. PCC 7502]|uniref:metallophosphoesterase family protein n=1 Tax=Synechococcus sp. PCC 7502 TaxID=1173263 RepID=UPI00029FB803|nr:metallophosphoesterase [Synechococcus sp. PCC 7502]AFY73164.1 putative phosphohydrolase [Synechococcus sp. PCC 7502]
MKTSFKFAIASDLHIALPQTIWHHPSRFHLVEYSIPAFEVVLEQIAKLDIDFLLLPGDLTQHGEPENHAWLVQRLSKLPYPVYVIPGNHDVPRPETMGEFAPMYQAFGYTDKSQLYYTKQILPKVWLIGLNSNNFNSYGDQVGEIDPEQINWLEATLENIPSDELILVTVHHNVVEHLPQQKTNPLGRRYMLSNADRLCELLHKFGVKLVFTGHLHVQDIAKSDRYDLYDITTGSLVSYPHPYRVLTYTDGSLQVESYVVKSIPECQDLQQFSREWMGDRAVPFVMRLLTDPPLCNDSIAALEMAKDLRYFWADIAGGDADFRFPQFALKSRNYFEAFSDRPPADNNTVLELR